MSVRGVKCNKHSCGKIRPGFVDGDWLCRRRATRQKLLGPCTREDSSAQECKAKNGKMNEAIALLQVPQGTVRVSSAGLHWLRHSQTDWLLKLRGKGLVSLVRTGAPTGNARRSGIGDSDLGSADDSCQKAAKSSAATSKSKSDQKPLIP